MADVAKKKYHYPNRIVATVKPAIKSKIKVEADRTGDSESGIVSAALDLYFKASNRQAKNGY